MKDEKQRLLIEHLLSSKDLFGRTSAIIKPSYFDPQYRRVVAFLHAYYQLYSSLPSFDVINAECELDSPLTSKDMKHNEFVYWCDECEQFARKSAMKAAIQTSVLDMQEGNYDKIYEAVGTALKISLDRDIGIDLFDDPAGKLNNCLENLDFISTGIQTLDAKLGGGILRQQTTLFSANSGVGKSVIMSNIGANVSIAGYHVLYLSLELPQNMIFTRLASIVSGESIKEWRTNTQKMAARIESQKSKGVGSYIIKRMPNGTTANDIRAYLKQYEMEFERFPDVILVDYLDQMMPNGGTEGMAEHVQDKRKSEQLYEIGVECNSAIITASQQNRSGLDGAPTQGVIAGGFSKINIMDNYISLKMDDVMRLEGIMLMHFLKTRSSDAVGSSTPVKFNAVNLQITDIDDMNRVNQLIKRMEGNAKNGAKTFTKPNHDVTIRGKVGGLPDNGTDEPVPTSQKEDFVKQLITEF